MKSLIETLEQRENKISVKQHTDWISVDERLPSPYQSVLVFQNGTLNGRSTQFFGIACLDEDDYWCYDDYFGWHTSHHEPTGSGNDLLKVEFWQPLPKPPKKDSKND